MLGRYTSANAVINGTWWTVATPAPHVAPFHPSSQHPHQHPHRHRNQHPPTIFYQADQLQPLTACRHRACRRV